MGVANDIGSIDVEIIYAEPQRHALVRLRLPAGSTLQQAVEASGLLRKFPEIDLTKNRLGIYGRIGPANTVLSTRDRIEIYRSLMADPKEIRKQRAAAIDKSRRVLKP
ncbi:MAG: RnfH family protein [Rhodocyclaceae bacterium]|nr:MAG: RnfH family protein [Rhodocyclaceae bacterium]